MSTLTGQYISQSYGGLINLSTNTGIVAGTFTQLQDGLGTNLGVFFNGQAAVSASSFTGSLQGTSSFAVTASFALNVPATASYALQALSSSYAITASFALQALSSSYAITASYAENAGSTIDTGSFATTGSNTFTGDQIVNGLTLGRGTGDIDSNTVFGTQSFVNNSSATNCIAIGKEALSAVTTGCCNIAIGTQAGNSITDGLLNTIIGHETGKGVTGNGNTIIGRGNMSFGNSGGNNVNVGQQVMEFSQNSANNTALGCNAFRGGSGNRNVVVGENAFSNASSGCDSNVVLGDHALSGTTTASGNTILGTFVSTSATLNDNLIIGVGGNYDTSTVAVQLITGTTSSINLLKDTRITGSLFVSGTINGTLGSLNLSGSLILTGSSQGNVVQVTVASNTASIDLSKGSYFNVNLPNSTNVFFNITNQLPGTTSNLVVNTGTNNTASFSTNVKMPSTNKYTPTSTSGSIDILNIMAIDSTTVFVTNAPNLVCALC